MTFGVWDNGCDYVCDYVGHLLWLCVTLFVTMCESMARVRGGWSCFFIVKIWWRSVVGQ